VKQYFATHIFNEDLDTKDLFSSIGV